MVVKGVHQKKLALKCGLVVFGDKKVNRGAMVTDELDHVFDCVYGVIDVGPVDEIIVISVHHAGEIFIPVF